MGTVLFADTVSRCSIVFIYFFIFSSLFTPQIPSTIMKITLCLVLCCFLLNLRFESGTAAPISGVEEASKAQRVEWLQGLLRLQRRKDLHLNFDKDYSKRKEVIREKRSCASIVNWFWKLACKVLG